MKNLTNRLLILGIMETISLLSLNTARVHGCVAGIEDRVKLRIGFSSLASFLSTNSFVASNESKTRYIDLAMLNAAPDREKLYNIVEGDCIKIPLFTIKVVGTIADMPPRIFREPNKNSLNFLKSKIEYEEDGCFVSFMNVIYARINYKDGSILRNLQIGNKLDISGTIVTIKE